LQAEHVFLWGRGGGSGGGEGLIFKCVLVDFRYEASNYGKQKKKSVPRTP
jgi:hypothetical protein